MPNFQLPLFKDKLVAYQFESKRKHSRMKLLLMSQSISELELIL